MEQKVISFIVSNQPGVLCRISGLISRRGYNIESLTVGVTNDPALSRMTIVLYADEKTVEQVIKQLNKLIDVKFVKEIYSGQSTLCEVALIKVSSQASERISLMEMVTELWGRVLDIGDVSTTIEISGSTSYINNAISQLSAYSIQEVARTGMVALERGDSTLRS